MSHQLATVLTTTLALTQQFQGALSQPAAPSTESSANDAKALPLLSASSNALKAQVTKLSLLTVTTPFTHSAVQTVLRACNDSVLPSLLTAALLVNPAEYTSAFHSESVVLNKVILTEFSALVTLVKDVSEKKDQAKQADPKKKEEDLSKAEKDAITVATGRVWDACDAVMNMATNGVVGFIAHRVEQWRELVKDAVEELENWDPEEAGDDFFDDILDDDDGEGGKSDSDDESKDEEHTTALQEHKKSTIRLLKPLLQVYPAIIKNRLKNTQDTQFASSANIARLEKLIKYLHRIPDQVDEAAGGLYEDDLDTSASFLRKVQHSATRAVETATLPWASDEAGGQSTEDKFVVWSKTWSKVMEEVGKPFHTKSGESGQ